MENQTEKSPPTISRHTGVSVESVALRQPIRLGAKTLGHLYEPGYSLEMETASVVVDIGIGPDHSAHLVMSLGAYEALLSGQMVDTTTAKEFADKVVKGSRRITADRIFALIKEIADTVVKVRVGGMECVPITEIVKRLDPSAEGEAVVRTRSAQVISIACRAGSQLYTDPNGVNYLTIPFDW